MRNNKLLQLAISILIASLPFQPLEAQEDQLFLQTDSDYVKARKIMEAVDKRGNDPLALVSETTMIIVKGDPDNSILKRSKTYRKKYSDNLTKTLSETIYPSRIKILTYSYKDRSDDIWIKLSSGSPKRISGKGKHDYIQNSHFTYEDMESKDLDEYEFLYLEKTTIKVEGLETPCYRVQGRKIKGEESRYSKIHNFIRISDLFIVRTDMWDKNGNPHKTLRILRTQTIKGREEYTIAVKIGVSLVDDPTTKRINEGKNQYTIMEMTGINVDDFTQIDESMFRKESL